jgi:hypothetical protein
MNQIHWYFGLFSSAATFAAATFFLNFIARKLFKSELIGDFINYSVKMLIKNGMPSIISIITITIINYFTHEEYFGHYLSIKYLGLNLLSMAIFSFTFSIVLKVTKKKSIFNVAVYGSFTIKEDKKIRVDAASEQINKVIEGTIRAMNRDVYSYSKSMIGINYIRLPNILVSLLGFTKLNDKIRLEVNKKNHFVSIHFIKNVSSKSISAYVSCDECLLQHPQPTENLEKLINNLLSNPSYSEKQAIEASVKLYLLVYSQVLLDYFTDSKNYKVVHYILDSCEGIVSEIRIIIPKNLVTLKCEVDDYLKFWLSHIERYRAIAFLEQKEGAGSVKAIFKAISLNPYYPYDTYTTLKHYYTKRYGIELIPSINSTIEKMGVKGSKPETNLRIREELKRQVLFLDTTYHYEILKEIIRRNEKGAIIELIEEELSKLDQESPFLMLTKCEILKYLPKGKQKINEIFAERVDDCCVLLREVIRLDPEFILVYTKLGSLLLLRGVHYNNQSLVREGFEEYAKGQHFLSRLGIQMTPE